MKNIFLVALIALTLAITGCGTVASPDGNSNELPAGHYGAYWEFGEKPNDINNKVYLKSGFDCNIQDIDKQGVYKVICTEKSTGDVYNMYVPFYKEGTDWTNGF